MSKSPLYRATANMAHKHSRVSMVAAAAAAAGMLVAGVSTLGAAPWAQALDNASKTVQGDSPTTPGQQGAFLFDAITGTKGVSKPASGAQLDSVSTKPVRHKATVATASPSKLAAQPVKQSQGKAVHAVENHALAEPTKPYTIYDSVTPGSIPGGQPAAVYVDGAYSTSWADMSGHHSVLWIDTNGSDPHADVLDVEPGDATPAGAAQWVKDRLDWHSDAAAVVYTMLSDWQQVKANVATLPSWMQSHVRYWIADPTGVPHVVAGSSATQWYWGTNFDITTAEPDF